MIEQSKIKTDKNIVLFYIGGLTFLLSVSRRLNDLGIVVNQTAKNEHVPEIERAGRTLKERVRVAWNTSAYKLTNDMIVSIIIMHTK